MQIFDAAQTRDRLDYTALADAVADVIRGGRAEAPVRTAVPLPESGTLLLMPAADDRIAMTKLVTVHPHNVDRDLPTIQGEMVVMDARTGVRLGQLDGATVSARRTAAVSLLAARTLATGDTASLLIVGAGVQAQAHLEAFHEGLGVRRVFIQSRTRERADNLARAARERGLEAQVVDAVEDVVDQVRLIATTTTSRQPVLPDSLPEGTFVAAVGAFNPQMAELPPALIERSSVYVDTLEGAREEAGDLMQAAESGRFDWARACTLAQALEQAPDDASGVTLFKSVGCSLWDLAAARLAFAD